MKRLNWDEVRPHIGGTLRDDETEIKRQVETGEAAAFQIGECYLVGRGEGSEFVAMCVEGKNVGPAMRELYAVLKKAGFSTVRLHTQAKGLERLLNRELSGLIKFDTVETVHRGTL